MGGRHQSSSTSSASRYGGREDAAGAQSAPNFRYYNTATDDTNDAAGLPLSSVLVLRNLARQLNKIPPPTTVTDITSPSSPAHKRTFSASEGSPEAARRATAGGKKPRLSDAAAEQRRENEEKEEEEAKNAGWVPRIFAPLRDQIAFTASHNLTLRNYVGGLLKAIAEGGG